MADRKAEPFTIPMSCTNTGTQRGGATNASFTVIGGQGGSMSIHSQTPLPEGAEFDPNIDYDVTFTPRERTE